MTQYLPTMKPIDLPGYQCHHVICLPPQIQAPLVTLLSIHHQAPTCLLLVDLASQQQSLLMPCSLPFPTSIPICGVPALKWIPSFF